MDDQQESQPSVIEPIDEEKDQLRMDEGSKADERAQLEGTN
jgi:hypothetical protein